MGKITVSGTAEKEIPADIAEISVRFQTRANSTSNAIKKITEQCEEFLSILKNIGFDMKHIRIKDDHIQQNYFDNRLNVTASKSISIKIKLDSALNNYIISILKSKNYDVNYNIEYKVSNLAEIHRQLLKEALSDSKRKAEIVAETMNQHIIGIDSMNTSDIKNPIKYKDIPKIQNEEIRGVPQSKTPLTDNLEPPVNTESETVEAVWIME